MSDRESLIELLVYLGTKSYRTNGFVVHVKE